MAETAKREKKEIVIAENRDFKGVWIPERIYLTREFTPNEKFLLIEIYSLTKKRSRECFANNKHFADFVGLKENTVQKMMLKFENAGYIKRDYEYREGTKEIERRTIKLTQKFYDNFINESDKSDFSTFDMENNPEENGFESMEGIDKNPQGSGLKVGEKYNNFKYNSDLSDTDLSNKGENINKVNGEVKTCSSRKKSMDTPKTRLEKYRSMKSEEKDMIEQVRNICDSILEKEEADEICNTLEHYFSRYTEKTGKIHPILKTQTLIDIVDKMSTYSDTEYGHFESLIDDEGMFIKIVDAFFDGDFGQVTGHKTNWNLPHFMSDGVLDRLAQRVFMAEEV